MLKNAMFFLILNFISWIISVPVIVIGLIFSLTILEIVAINACVFFCTFILYKFFRGN